MNKGLVLGLVAMVVIAGVFLFISNGSSSNEAMMSKESLEKAEMEKAQMAETEAVKKVEMMESDDSAIMAEEETVMNKEETGMMKKDDSAMMPVGSYVAYDAAKIAMASASQDVVLFFKASWCPSCKAVDADIKANLKAIPSSLTILDVDYDNSADLKRKYGVTTQHTFVQVDAQGTLIKKWSGGSTLASVVSKVQ